MANTELKAKIRAHLGAVGEATAKKIAVAIGMKDYPSDVVKALSDMRTDTEIECEKRKGNGNEYVYWLVNAAGGTTDKELVELRAQVGELRRRLEEKRADCTREANRADKVQEALEQSDARLGVMGTMLVNIEGDGIEAKLGKVLHELCHAKIQIDALNEQLMSGEEAVDVKDAARGYLVCAPKRKPAKLMSADSAVARAKSAAKATGRCEVFALVPVGVAVRKQVKAVEFKKANAA